jgi:hypothetical protein
MEREVTLKEPPSILFGPGIAETGIQTMLIAPTFAIGELYA